MLFPRHASDGRQGIGAGQKPSGRPWLCSVHWSLGMGAWTSHQPAAASGSAMPSRMHSKPVTSLSPQDEQSSPSRPKKPFLHSSASRECTADVWKATVTLRLCVPTLSGGVLGQ